MRLILIRHGQTTSNVVGSLDTAIPGAPLTELGAFQAKAIPEALVGETIEVLVASNAMRAQSTSAPLAATLGLGVLLREGIREISAGDLEMRSDRGAVELYLETVLAWARGDFGPVIPGGERGDEVMARFDSVVAEVVRRGVGTAVFVSHGSMIRAWAAWVACNVDAEYAGHHGLSNMGVVVLEGSPHLGWEVKTWSGEPLGGDVLSDEAADGPAADEI